MKGNSYYFSFFIEMFDCWLRALIIKANTSNISMNFHLREL